MIIKIINKINKKELHGISSIAVRVKSSRATFNVYRNLVNIGHEVLKICSRTNTDRQTDRQTIICSPAGRRKYFVKCS